MKRSAFRKLLKMTFAAIQASGSRVHLHDGEDRRSFGKSLADQAAFLEMALGVDECTVSNAQGHWIRFIWFNDPEDCLSDYSVALEGIVAPIQAAAERIAAGDFDIVLHAEEQS